MLYLVGNAFWLLILLLLFFLSGSAVLLLRRDAPQTSAARSSAARSSAAGSSATQTSTAEGLPSGNAVEHLDSVLARLALGAAAWMGVLFLLATLGLLRSGPVFAGIVLATIGGLAGLRRYPLPSGSGPSLPPALIDRLPTALLSLTVLAVGLGLWIHTQRPDLAWDADVYHLTVPKLYLEEGGFTRLPFNVYSNWPLNTQLLYALALLLDGRVLAKQLHFVFGLLAAATAFALVIRPCATDADAAPSPLRGDRLAGTIAAVLFLANPVVLYEIRIAYVDLAYAFYFALAFLFLHRFLEEDSEGRNAGLGQGRLLTAGVLSGIAAGIKLNGFFAPLTLAGIWAASRLLGLRRRGSEEPAPVPWAREALLLLGPSILVLPWLAKSWLLTGNPVYPLFWSTFGGPEWSAELGRQHAAWQSAIGMGRAPLDYLLLPWRVIALGDFGYGTFDGQVARAWLVLIPLTLVGAWRDRLVRRALAAAAIFFLLWSLTSQQIRFLIPVIPVLAAAAGRALLVVSGRLEARWSRLVAWLAAAAAGALLLQPAWIYLRQDPRLLADLLRHGSTLEDAVPSPIYRVIDEQLPADARLMLVNTNRAFFVERDAIADSFFEASQLAAFLNDRTSSDAGDSERIKAAVRELGVTHVLVENVNRGIPWPRAFLELLNDARRSPVVFRSADSRFTLLRLDW